MSIILPGNLKKEIEMWERKGNPVPALIVLASILICVSPLYAQEGRIFVELTVLNGELGEEAAYAAAREFINAINFAGLEKLELPDTGFVDAKVLKKFVPSPLKGSRTYVETFDERDRVAEGPTTKKDLFQCYAYVKYLRQAEDQNIWDEIRIYIRDTGRACRTAMRGMHLSSRHKEHTESTKIKGYDATVWRNPRNKLDEGDEVQISISIPSAELDWSKIMEAAKEGVRKGTKLWSCAARFTNGSINGPELYTPPGSLEGPSFEDIIVDEIMALDVPVQIAISFAGPVWSGWEFWSVTFTISSCPAFPSFAVFPGPQAPPTPAQPIPVSMANFDRDVLEADTLETQILSRLGKYKEDPDAQRVVSEFAQWFDECFTSSIASSQITSLMGQGPVPTFAPPEVPSGPVVGGQVIASPVIFSNFEF